MKSIHDIKPLSTTWYAIHWAAVKVTGQSGKKADAVTAEGVTIGTVEQIDRGNAKVNIDGYNETLILN